MRAQPARHYADPVTAPAPLPGAKLLFTLDATVDYLNHGSFGVPPIAVQRAQQRLREEMEGNPARFLTRGLHERLAHARTHLAGFIGAEPEHSALVANTTTGVSLVLHTLDLQPGDEVITTEHGYGAVALAIAGYGARPVIAPVALDADDDAVVEAVLAARTPRTRLAVIDLITSPTARIMPAGRVATALREVGVPVLVDGAHAPGAVPLDVSALGADFFVGNLHKWAYAPRGTALLVVAAEWVPRMRPLVVSWAQEIGFPGNVEFLGSLDYTGWLAGSTGLYVLRSLGVERVREYNDALAGYAQRVLAAALATEQQLPDPGGALPMRIVPLPERLTIGAHTLRDLISDRLRTEVAVSFFRNRLWLRICAQVYNTADQYDRLAERLPALLAEVS